VPVLVALGGVLAVAAVVYWENSRPAPPRPPVAVSQPVDDPVAALLLDYADPETLMPASRELMFERPGDTPLDGEPAALPPPPGSAPSMRETAFRRRNMGVLEEVSVWRTQGVPLEELAEHYDTAAISRGFSMVELQPPATQPATTYPANPTGIPRLLSMTFSRDPAVAVPPHRVLQHDMLVVRAVDVDGDTRLLVWLRLPQPRGMGRGMYRGAGPYGPGGAPFVTNPAPETRPAPQSSEDAPE
jgi:hypothetical protein